MREVYRNINATRIYLHMVLLSGYHDDDRDIITISMRSICCQLNISLSAVRHSLRVLQSAGLIKPLAKSTWQVNKWVLQGDITPRLKSAKDKAKADKQAALRAARDEEQHRLDKSIEETRRQKEQYAKQGTSSFDVYLRSLKAKADAGDLEALAKYNKLIKYKQ